MTISPPSSSRLQLEDGLETVVPTPRSSMTFTNPDGNNIHRPSPLRKPSKGSNASRRSVSSISAYSRQDDVQTIESKSRELPFESKDISQEETADPNLVGWDGPDDPENPLNWSTGYRTWLTIICMALCLNVTFASSAPATLSLKVAAHFKVTQVVSSLITTVFLVGYCFGPLFWGPGSEVVGRRPTLVVSMVCYTLFILGQALAKNMETLLITRFLSGFFGCAPLTNAAAAITDMWDAEARGLAISLFTASVFMGPVLGPIVSGFIANSPVTWRWVYWVMIMFAGACTFSVFFLPETYTPVLLAKKAQRLREEDPVANKDLYGAHERHDTTFVGLLKRTVRRPLEMLAREPIMVLVTAYLSLVYGLLYCLFQAIPIIFIKHHDFSMGQSGLVFIGVGIGTTIGSIIFLGSAAMYPALNVKWRGYPPAEYRLIGAMIGSPLLIIGCFWLGWTGQSHSVHWAAPAVSTIFIGTGISSIFMSFLAYLVDTYVAYSASALAANTVVRSAVAAAFPLFTVQMFDKLGVNWACSLIGFIMLAFAPAPFLFFKFGPSIRQNSTFSQSLDLKIAAEIAEEERQANEKAAGLAV